MQIPPAPQRIYAIINPISSRAEAAGTELANRCEALGLPDPRVLTTTVTDPGIGQAKAAVDDAADLVVVAGGDGTVRQVAGVISGTGVPLGILPIGSANIFARNLMITRTDLGAAVTLALTGSVAKIDQCWVETRIGDAWSNREPMLAMAGIGRDGATVAEVKPEAKQHLGWFAYAASGVKQAFAEPFPMQLRIDGAEPVEQPAWSVLVANCGRVPGNTVVFPDALLDDGRLNVLRVSVDNPLKWIAIAAKGLTNFGASVPGLEYTEAATVEVSCDIPQPVQIDGDVIENVSAIRVHLDPGALLVRVPLRVK